MALVNINEVLSSDWSPDVIYPEVGVWCSTKSFQENAGIIAQVGICLLCSTSFPVYYSLITKCPVLYCVSYWQQP